MKQNRTGINSNGWTGVEKLRFLILRWNMDIHGIPWMEKTSSKNVFLEKTSSKNGFLEKTSPKKRFFDQWITKKAFFDQRITKKVFFWPTDHQKSVFLTNGSPKKLSWKIRPKKQKFWQYPVDPKNYSKNRRPKFKKTDLPWLQINFWSLRIEPQRRRDSDSPHRIFQRPHQSRVLTTQTPAI